MAYWLLKTEPSTYSWDDLAREGGTVWSGVRNATALIHLRSMKKGDKAAIYHTGGESRAVGIAEIASGPYPDPNEKNEKLVVVEIKLGRALARPVTLEQIKADPMFKGWDLLRISRLSVVPTPEKMWRRLGELAEP